MLGSPVDASEQGQRLREQDDQLADAVGRIPVSAVAVSGRMRSRGMNLALCAIALTWAATANGIAGRAAQGLSVRFQLGALEAWMECVFLLFLVVVGFRMLDWIANRGHSAGEVLELPKRSTRWQEWSTGAAIGWGLSLAAALPLLLSGHMHAQLNWQPGSALAILLALATLLTISLAEEVIFRGYPFRRLTQALGPAWAAVVLSVIFGIVLIEANPPSNALMALIDGTLFGLLLAIAWMRTHALWLGWGLHFAYRAVTAVVLGLPIAGHGQFGSIADTYATGPRWLSGGAFGQDAAFLTSLAMLGGMVVLYRATRQYAWEYTFPTIVPAGYEVTVAPPAAHVAMEKAASPAPLVQILPTTPQTRSVGTWSEDRQG